MITASRCLAVQFAGLIRPPFSRPGNNDRIALKSVLPRNGFDKPTEDKNTYWYIDRRRLKRYVVKCLLIISS